MKKLVMAVTVAAMMTVGVLSVSAAGVEGEFVPNMNAENYRVTRTAQVEAAHDAKSITEAEYLELLEHINTVVNTEAFGNGPSNGVKGDGNATCILGEDSELGLFRSESAGMRTGNGNGVGIKAQDGTNAGKGNRRGGQGNGAGNGLQDGVCVIAE